MVLWRLSSLGGRNEEGIFNPAGKKGCCTFVAVCFAGCASLSCLGHDGSVSVAILCSLSYLWEIICWLSSLLFDANRGFSDLWILRSERY